MLPQLSFSDWIDLSLAIMQALALVALVVYVVKTWEIASATRASARSMDRSIGEMQKTRDAESAPYVIVYFEIPYGRGRIDIVLKNAGRLPAHDITVDFRPELTGSRPERVKGLFAEPIAMLAPGQEVRSFFDMGHAYLSEEKDFPLTYSARVRYRGGIDERWREERQSLDLTAYIGTVWSPRARMKDVVDELRKIERHEGRQADELRSVAGRLARGVWIRGPGGGRGVGQSAADWQREGVALAREFISTWNTATEEVEATPFGESLVDLQARLSLIADRFYRCIGHGSFNTQPDTARQVVRSLEQLSRWEFYGPDSWAKFLEAGEEAVEKARTLFA